MTRISISLLGATLLAALAMPAAAAQRDGEAELAKAVAGRDAGKPVDCIYLRDIRSTRIIDGTAIVYEMNNGLIYVNRPKSGASSLDWTDVMITDTHSSQLCSIDTVKLFDTGVRMPTGWVGLGDFVPYPRPPKNAPKS
ncbi:hypothetical protein P6144_10710 [Sphingomonas sp. HITSZ_GF]|uniref:hypothetical protein n=1 Tax=Sphingomonas sp. HITSZ_GF TaxID=3037247 RepID=UPI00240D073D|nr:hypothetical protein [Sphingomonas sp. HITSZ_GF]MDG2534120.1 hypothetical protein [Sphingomonas sp. HITSZ_GF]